jgi:tetratricopeptide (TPR) repeat protein
MFDELHRARKLSEEALRIFEDLGVQRGIGSASITLGRALRKLGALGLDSPEECDKFFRDAAGYLQRAIEIFQNIVNEPARLIEAHDELGCTYRDRAALARIGKSRTALAQGLARDAVKNLETSAKQAKGEYPVLYVDVCEDLAQVFYQQQEYTDAHRWLQNAESQIPDCYKSKPGTEPCDVPPEECVEEFWLMLGKIGLLRGYLAYDTGLGRDGKVSRQGLEKAIEHFALAYTYFERYSARATGLETTLKQLYNRFKKCKYGDLRHIQDDVLPQIAKDYSLNPSKLAHFFEDTLGLALQMED